ncbi:MAG: polyhydroxyalkanoate synthesis repressor PhaR [Acetobacteraceae bacterium]|nr:polyhydroxyalkanoate synthesis repressor PhaR [Acetobacteraceae bacterium]
MSEPAPSGPERPPENPPAVVKKYANRRLYNTESSSYITLDSLAEMVREGRDFVVYDAKTGEDITRSVLTQIIVEEEGKGRAMLPTSFLRQLIGFYGDSLQNLVPRYLDEAMRAFALQQQQMRRTMQQTMGNFFPFGMEEVGRQNMNMIERAMSFFTPFYNPAGTAENGPGVSDQQNPAESAAAQEIAALRAEVERLQRLLAQVTAGKEEDKVPVSEDPEGPHQLHAARTPKREQGTGH